MGEKNPFLRVMRPYMKILFVIVCCTIAMYFLENIDNIINFFGTTESGSHYERILSLQKNSSKPPNGFRHDTSEKIPDPKHKFKKVFYRGVLTLHNVCIEPDPKHRKVDVQKRLKLGTHLNMKRKVLVVYNARRGMTSIHKVGAHSNVRVRDWEVIYRPGPPPKSTTVIDSHTAYFMTSSCDGNLWLFFEDTLRGLYTVIKKSNRLHSEEKNIVYYREPLWEYHKLLEKYVQCWDPFRFEEMLLSLNLKQPHDTIHKATSYTCYKNAVFGVPPQKNWASRSEVASYIVKHIGINKNECPPGHTVTLLQRKNRVILNMDQLQDKAIRMGFNNTVVTVFEDISSMDQMKIVRCTDIFVGVHGAGLAWGLFLPKGAALVEIAWPQHGWPFLYSGRFKGYNNIQVFKLNATKVLLNYDTFSMQCKMGKPLSETEKAALAAKRKPMRIDYNQWKWADVFVDPDKFGEILYKVKTKLKL